ncbi:class I SAM-dependent methyltransferase [Tsukamurella sp. 1534]|uniref:class I SAM-dependent DNA methyltransferase n=1 Tax=Tsukamurella sp. 1534 TaxID=1151061 RepID=UPI000305A8F2|nr:class I SAM-dependent methyltransferase [Tsukamurella sp. 1534]
MTQPGYDALAATYEETFPDPFYSPLERRAVDAFADAVGERDGVPRVIDVGCGTGNTARHLSERGLTVDGVDPSVEMLAIARNKHAGITFHDGDHRLAGVDLGTVDGVLARFSLIHVRPEEIPPVLADWRRRLPAGALLLVAGQANDEAGVVEFDHAVAPAWRWHPDSMAATLAAAGFAEVWRTVSRPDATHRFPEYHLLARAD